MTKTGVGRYLMVFRHRSGLVEEIRLSFNDWGMTMVTHILFLFERVKFWEKLILVSLLSFQVNDNGN
jgi:hypothetical protein